MPLDTLDPRSALIVVDLQQGITTTPFAHPMDRVIANTAALAIAYRTARLPVVLVVIDFAPDGADAIRRLTDLPAPPPPQPGFADLAPELNRQPTDILITKRTWNSFHGTEIDLQLRRRGVTTVVMTGIATSIGVESTARGAFDRDYDVIIAADTLSDPVRQAHEASLKYVMPRLGRVTDTATILAQTVVNALPLPCRSWISRQAFRVSEN